MAHQYGTPASAAPPTPPPLSLVDRLFLLTHDTGNGKPLVALDVLGLGLAGAALLELATSGNISIKRSGEVVRVSQYGHHDEASHYVLTQIYDHEPQTESAPDWITHLRGDLYLGVAGTLGKRGLVQEQRSPLRGVRYIPTPKDPAEESMAWVYRLFQSPRLATSAGNEPLQLACLAGALGIAATVTALPNSEVTAGYRQLFDHCDIQAAQIVTYVQSAASKLAMTPRR